MVFSMSRFLFHTIIAALSLTVAQMLAGALVFSVVPDALPPVPSGSLPWQIAANVAAAATLVWIGMRSAVGGPRLAVILGLLYFTLMHFSSLIEGYFFGFFDGELLLVLLAFCLVSAAFFIVALAAQLERREHQRAQGWSTRVTPSRFVLGSLAYLVTYFIAGMIIYPYIRGFYDSTGTPPPLEVISMQLFVRGPIFVALAILILHISTAGRRETVAMIAIYFSVIGGVAPLVVPNGFFPDSVRWMHFFEVSISNLLYGFFLGWLLSASQRLRHPEGQVGMTRAA
jgi:hypothetical protein